MSYHYIQTKENARLPRGVPYQPTLCSSDTHRPHKHGSGQSLWLSCGTRKSKPVGFNIQRFIALIFFVAFIPFRAETSMSEPYEFHSLCSGYSRRRLGEWRSDGGLPTLKDHKLESIKP